MKPHSSLVGIFSLFGAMLAIGLSMTTVLQNQSLSARLVDRPVAENKWITLTEQQVESGTTLPANTNVFFHIPESTDVIDRETLFGERGTRVRYWGYCFPDPKDPANLPNTVGLPGKFFLSEAERAWRAEQEKKQTVFSPFQAPVQTHGAATQVRHQVDTLHGGIICYTIAAEDMPFGSDSDDDGLNSKLEAQYGTDPHKADTDGDGIMDGTEIFYATNALVRDTDADGLLDGIEDKNHNGRVDLNETDPRKRDSDGDTFCDGLCHEYKVRKVCSDNAGRECVGIPYGQLLGEDTNLNGKVDTGETDPTKQDSLGDGVRDDQRYFKCILTGGKTCLNFNSTK